MKTSLDDVCYASLPATSLHVLAPLRVHRQVRAQIIGARAWVRWEPENPAVLQSLLPVTGIELFVRRGDHWHPFGCRVPVFELPSDENCVPLHRVLLPVSFESETPSPMSLRRMSFQIVLDDRPRPTSAMLVDVQGFARWLDTVPWARFASMRAAWNGLRLLVLGERLPWLHGSSRFWGSQVLTPLGYRPEPALPEDALRKALAIQEEELLVLTTDGAEAIARSTLVAVSRSGVRRAVLE